jgi:hypothetical protein
MIYAGSIHDFGVTRKLYIVYRMSDVYFRMDAVLVHRPSRSNYNLIYYKNDIRVKWLKHLLVFLFCCIFVNFSWD